MNADIVAHFAEQAGYCAALGSPFTSDLIAFISTDYQQGGPVAALVEHWPTSPRADVLALRLTGAAHAAALLGRDSDVAAMYASQPPAWRADQVWPSVRAFFARDSDWVRAFIQSAPQTNETRRSIALLAAFLTFGREWKGPVDMLEIGASAGLNQNWDRFFFETASWRWGDPNSAVRIDTDWSGPPPPSGTLDVRRRAACDLNPLDLREREQALRLKAYVWPDQPERLARFDGAVALALRHKVRVDRADAAGWLQQKLAQKADDAATLVFHSVFLQYPPRATRKAIEDALVETGANAKETAPLVWVRMEPEALTDGVRDSARMVIDLTTWPGGARRIVGYTDGHVRAIQAL